MKKYIREHIRFVIVVITLLLILIASTSYLLINKKYEETFNLIDIEKNTFKYTINEETGNSINSIVFIDNINGKRIFELKDEKQEFEFTYNIDDTKGEKVINVYINGITTTYKYINDCIYDITVPDILYCK